MMNIEICKHIRVVIDNDTITNNEIDLLLDNTTEADVVWGNCGIRYKETRKKNQQIGTIKTTTYNED